MSQSDLEKERIQPSAPTPPQTLPSVAQVAAPPNGGVKAWFQVLGAFMLFFNSWGIVNSFGVYQAFYETDLLQSRNSSDISWIGTFQAFLLVISSIIVGPLFDRGYLRALLIVGTILVVLGQMMTSLGKEYWQIFLAQGLCIGLGSGCLFLPSVATVATYFTTKRALAIGITASGGSVGSVIYPIVFHRLQPEIGFPWAVRVVGFIMLATLLVSIAVMRPRLPPNKGRAMFDINAIRSLPFILFSIGGFLLFAGLYVPIFYITVYAQKHASINEDMAFYLLAVLNAASFFGRVIPGLVADKIGSLESMIICILVVTAFGYAWMAIRNLAGFIMFAIIYGFFSGAAVSLPNSVIAEIVPEMKLVGTWMGISFCFFAVGILIGSPIAGTIINVDTDDFTSGFIFTGSMNAAAAAILILASWIKSRPGQQR
ncbi:putative MFS monocarboxylate transporter [Xylogone sp. PMI_703]|nr:putative MFS monocarboxylate transporter [Xylogone sp. PMI_703]